MLCLPDVAEPDRSPQWEVELFKNLEIGGFVAPPEIMHPPTMASLPGPVQSLPLQPDLP